MPSTTRSSLHRRQRPRSSRQRSCAVTARGSRSFCSARMRPSAKRSTRVPSPTRSTAANRSSGTHEATRLLLCSAAQREAPQYRQETFGREQDVNQVRRGSWDHQPRQFEDVRTKRLCGERAEIGVERPRRRRLVHQVGGQYPTRPVQRVAACGGSEFADERRCLGIWRPQLLTVVA